MTEVERVSIFCGLMNKKAAELGMKNSTFNDPAGINNFSTARDIMQVLLQVAKNETVNSIWTKRAYTVNIEGDCPRTLELISKTLQGEGNGKLLESYKVLAGKGGTLTYKNINNSSILALDPAGNGRLACVVMGAWDPNSGPNNRFNAAKQVFDKALGKGNAEICAESAIVYRIYDDAEKEPCLLYEQNADKVIPPASMSKMLTALTALDFIKDLNTKITVKEAHIALVQKGFYQRYLKAGDVISFFDLLHTLLLPSSNLGGFVIADYVGGLIKE